MIFRSFFPTALLVTFFILSTSNCSQKKIKVIKYKKGQLFNYGNTAKTTSDCLSMSDKECLAFKHINSHRKKMGLKPLLAISNCIEAAQYHSQQMEANKKLHHDGKVETWSQRVQRFNAIGLHMAENIALTDSHEKALQLWLNSKEHKNNLLNPVFTHSGLGISGRYWTQCFIEAGPTK